MSVAIFFDTSSFFDATVVAAGNPFAISAAKFGPEMIAILFFGNMDDTIWLGNFKLFISSPFEQQTKIVFSSKEFFNLVRTPERY